MAKYLFHGSYTQEGLKGLLKEGGTSRRDTIAKLVNGMGGTVEAFYYAFGGDDVYVIADVPETSQAVATSLVVNATGAVTLSTTVLVTPEEVDEATKISVPYRAPGQ